MEFKDFAVEDAGFNPKLWTDEFLNAYKSNNNIPFAKELQTLANTKGKDGNINHFVNVIFAMRHLMDYAVKELGFAIENDRRLLGIIAAFYHDLGKTKIDHRHALVGSIMLENAASDTIASFSVISSDHSKIADKLPLIAVIVRYHDVFGMSSTGEASAASLERAVKALREVTVSDAALAGAIDDLWMLNVADTVVSYPDKFNLGGYTKSKPGSIDSEIKAFFDSFKGMNMLSDLETAKRIAFEGLDGVEKAEEQAACRIQRLTWETFSKKVDKTKIDIFLAEVESDKAVIEIKTILKMVFGDNYNRAFGTFLQFDYALGIFIKIAEAVLKLPCADTAVILNTWYTVVIKVFKKLYEIKGDLAWNAEFEDVAKLTGDDIESLLGNNGIYDAEKTLDKLMKQIFLYK
jgi:hypothetical protein